MKQIYYVLAVVLAVAGIIFYGIRPQQDLQAAAAHCLIIGHRGFANDYPENTMRSFTHALPYVHALELDLQLTKDDHIVIMHDDTLDRTTDGSGFVRDHTLHELQKLDAGKGTTIPTLETVLKWADDKVRLAIEIKESDGDSEQLLDLLFKQMYAGYEDEIFFASFDHQALKELKEQHPEALTILNFRSLPKGDIVQYVQSFNANGAGFVATLVTKEMVHELREAGLLVGVYPINAIEHYHHFLNMNIDFAVTDNPKLIAKERTKLMHVEH